MSEIKKLSEYVKQKEFDFGLPQGDTIIDLTSALVEETFFRTADGKEKPSWRITTAQGDSFIVPKSVMASLKSAVADRKKSVRITRTGTGLNTRYTVVVLQ